MRGGHAGRAKLGKMEKYKGKIIYETDPAVWTKEGNMRIDWCVNV